MKIEIESPNTDLTDKLKDFVNEKVGKLDQYFDGIVRAIVTLKEGNDSRNKNYFAEIELSIPGPRLFAKAKEESFEAALTEAIEQVKKQLKKRKGKVFTPW